jgi:thioredoxin reductase (NADPH)
MSGKRVVILGSGSAGYTAAIYASRANLDTTILSGDEIGGQLGTTSDVENFPGWPEGILGPELMEKMKKQAERFGTKMKSSLAKSIDMSKQPFVIDTGDEKIEADALIVCTGAKARWLGLEGEKKYIGHGYTSCATCDGFFYRGKEVIVVGGGDSAMEEATFLTKFASKVYVVHRRDELRASKIMQDRALNHEKIEFIWNSSISKFHGEEKIESVTLKDTQTGEEKDMNIDGVFVAIGHQPVTEFLGGQISLDDAGYIVPQERTMTNVPGVFAAGDVVDTVYRQAITAAGMGCQAAIDAERWLEDQE